jgi:tetratricopeptide (TPR) repeat protein
MTDLTRNPREPGDEVRAAVAAELRASASEGIAAVRGRDFETGYRLLGEVSDAMRKAGERLPAWLISFYGLALAMHKGRHREAVELCQAAIDAEPMKAEYYANLVEACVAARQRRKAVSALHRGLAIDAGNPRLIEAQASVGSRREPVIGSLDRAHPLNVTLGRIRHAFAGPPKPARRPGNTKSG